jgi:hypothetical protein
VLRVEIVEVVEIFAERTKMMTKFSRKTRFEKV